MKAFTKWLLATFIMIVICASLFEVMSIAFLTLRDDKYISAEQRFDDLMQSNTFISEIASEDSSCRYIDSLFPHPYLGFVHNGNPPCGIKHINNIGMFGDDMPAVKPQDRFVVLVTGGSVASQFVGITAVPQRYLENILNANYVSPNGKPFLVLNGGDGAWKQPQQAILYLLYSDVVDAVVTLDGFNEHYMLKSSSRFELPASNFAMSNPLINHSYMQSVVKLMMGRLISGITHNPVLKHSQGMFLISTVANKALNYSVNHGEDRKTTVESIFARPSDWTEDQRVDEAIAQYRKYIRSIHALAEANQDYNAFFIQPVPAIDKTLTDEEKTKVGDLSYRDVYAKMTDDLLKLRNENIAIYSLLDVFKNNKESVYSDPIHVITDPEGKSEGYKQMAEVVAAKLAEAWKLKKK